MMISNGDGSDGVRTFGRDTCSGDTTADALKSESHESWSLRPVCTGAHTRRGRAVHQASRDEDRIDSDCGPVVSDIRQIRHEPAQARPIASYAATRPLTCSSPPPRSRLSWVSGAHEKTRVRAEVFSASSKPAQASLERQIPHPRGNLGGKPPWRRSHPDGLTTPRSKVAAYRVARGRNLHRSSVLDGANSGNVLGYHPSGRLLLHRVNQPGEQSLPSPETDTNTPRIAVVMNAVVHRPTLR